MPDGALTPLSNVLVAWLGSAVIAWATARYAWRMQARAKRKAEIAEEALLAFRAGVDALRWCRLDASWMIEPVEPSELSEEQRRHPGAEFELVLGRLRDCRKAFAAVETHCLLCELHLGAEASGHFANLLELINNVKRAAVQGVAAGRGLRETPASPHVSENVIQIRKDYQRKLENSRELIFRLADPTEEDPGEREFRALKKLLGPTLAYKA